MTDKIKTIKRISLIVGLAALLAAVLTNFLPILNIRLDGVESDYTFGAAGGHNFLGWQAIFYWWGPSIYIGGVSAFNFNIWLFLGMFLPVLALIVNSVMLKNALYRKKAFIEFIAAAAMLFGAFVYSSAPYFAAKTVGNHLVSYMKMAIEQGTYTLGWWCYVLVAAMLAGCAVKAFSAVFSLKNESAAQQEALAASRAQDPAKVRAKRRTRATAVIAAAMAVVLVLGIVAQVSMNAYSGAMDSFFGAGKVSVTQSEQAGSMDGEAYYEFTTHTTEESKALSASVNNEIVSEGVVLLKNEGNALPISKSAKITLLGVNSLHYVTGPGDDPYSNSSAISMKDGFEAAGFTVNPVVNDYYDRYSSANSNYSFDELMELDVRNYPSDVTASLKDYHDAAIVTLRRATGEGTDPAKDMGAGENNRTKLSPSDKELRLLEYACQNFDTVIVLVMSPNTMELGFIADGARYTDPYTKKSYDFSNIKGAFWVGGLGLTGAQALAEVLNGTTNPSGHLVDTYPRDLKADPTYQNVGLYEYTNTTSLPGVGDAEEFYCLTGQAFTVEYEEGIYVGYRYYETAAYEAARGNYAGFDYDRAVVYPFGYGLSYTTFDMSYDGAPVYDGAANEWVFQVAVTNTGAAPGKQVVQIYVSAPYDYNGSVEKSHVVLGGFGKTGVIEPGASETVEVRVQRDYIASYDYKDARCYILDAGDYKFYLSENAHSWASISDGDSSKCYVYNQQSKLEFKDGEKRTGDLIAAENLFDTDLNWKFKEYTENSTGSGYSTNFTRKDFAASFPTSPTGGDLVANDYVIGCLRTYKPDQGDAYPVDYGISAMPTTGKDAGIQLINMRGLDYDDPQWQTFIEQLTLDELTVSFGGGGWTEYPLEEYGIPYAYGCDGPAGLYSFVLSGVDTYYPHFAEVALSATWNLELAAKYGDALAEEAQAQRTVTNAGASVTYLFGPGADTHRSAFDGRNYEYYSEDGLLAGKMAAIECAAAAEKGLVTLLKHCALNEQETARQGANGSGSNATYTSFVNEQALREIYMRPWEIYAKEAKMEVKSYESQSDGSYQLVSHEMTGALAIMTSYNRIGGVWSGASPIVSGILRAECGFTGTSYTDAGGTINGYMNTDFGLHTLGTDVCLLPNQSPEATLKSCLRDKDSATTVYCLQDAAHRRLYNMVNSNAMLGLTPDSRVSYSEAPWQTGLKAAWVCIAILEIAGAAAIFAMWRKKERG